MDIKQLRYFVTASECLNYAHAAAIHYTTRHSITHAIKSLEEEFRRKLFVIEGNRPRLTPEGELFAKKAKRVVSEFDQMIRDFSVAADDYRNQTRVSIDSCLLPRGAKARGPLDDDIASRAFIEESDPEGCLRGLYDMRFDLAFARCDRLSFEGLGTACFGRRPLGVLVASAHPLGGRDRLSLADLGSCSLVVSRGHCYRHASLLSACRSRGIGPRVLSCVDDPSLTLSLVSRRRAAALVAMEGEDAASYGPYRVIPLGESGEYCLYDCLVYRDDQAQARSIRSFIRGYVMDGRLDAIGLAVVDPLIAELRGRAR
ncbi:LysR family transcriptional regulator [Adlercreutzia faecimuris]|uniref:LysR family transcriptional regulator n=1 Tax=Adlercreutzia faecimuris TaxID=2897341 RepID=A0ABS9WJ34_9ACTN|nr:LysR family transcriptional regulator [Adlercreutzia sp. JBNU-10]MCI2242888.1 LysR family transcriptional regulator [Adlercreutzia sp. JBNU-10]